MSLKIRSQILSSVGGVVYGFLDRSSGEEDIVGIARAFGLESIVTLKQVHGNRVWVVKDAFAKDVGWHKGDGLITNLRGVGIGVFTADCAPILFVDESSLVVAAVHAGWRGTLSKVVKSALWEFRKVFGIPSSRVYAVIGPSIGRCCYEVGGDVASLFIKEFGKDMPFLYKGKNSKYVLDIKEANSTILRCEGVERVEVIEVCTRCNKDFYSYRRDGKGSGRQLSFIGLV
ncbi:Laccase domain protein YfiH [bacterium HR37]|nr:Laccase domain protein YfiH [bacterium HR37]